jgi:hypothetical protein
MWWISKEFPYRINVTRRYVILRVVGEVCVGGMELQGLALEVNKTGRLMLQHRTARKMKSPSGFHGSSDLQSREVDLAPSPG